MRTFSFVRHAGLMVTWLTLANQAIAAPLVLPLGQIPGGLRDGFQSGLGIMFLAGFLWGVIKIWNGADKMSKGDADGKMGIVGGIIISAAAAIMAALFAVFGMADGALVPTF